MMFALAMFVLGVGLSAFFSGSETGFYRVSRMRLVLDALGGDWIARGLFWLTEHPSLFVATTLLGNNLAHHLVSSAMVLAAQSLSAGHLGEVALTLALTPVLFIYGELMPKNLFLHSPNRLLRRAAPPLFGFSVLFFPISAVLWGLNRLLTRWASRSDEPVRLALARRELQRMLEEGHEIGLLRPAQQRLARGIFEVAGRPVIEFAVPPAELPRARGDMTRQEILGLCRRYQIGAVCVEDSGPERRLIGYYRAVDLALDTGDLPTPPRRLLHFRPDDTHLNVVIHMQAAKDKLALVVDAAGRPLGAVHLDRLREPLFRGAR